MGIRIRNNMASFVRHNTDMMEEMLGRMAQDIMQIAKINVPLRTGDLHQSGKQEHVKRLHWKVSFGTTSTTQQYALIQERGRGMSHYTTPGTGPKYLENAGNKIQARKIQYVKQAAHKVHP